MDGDTAPTEVFVEAARPDSGRWLVQQDDSVLYEPAPGAPTRPAIIPASTLRGSSSWTRMDS
jgi:hypothetical protein